jgi:hypothetical protein
MSILSDIVRDFVIGLSEAALRQFGKKAPRTPWIHPHYWRWYVDMHSNGLLQQVADPACDTCGLSMSVAPERCRGPKGWKP